MFGRNPVTAQCFICISVNLSSYFMTGSIAGWATAVIPKFTDPDSPNILSENEIGWVTSIIGVGVIVGPILTLFVVDRIGRKATIALSVAPMIVSFGLMAVETEYTFLLVARAVGGAGVGITQSTVPMYIGEVSDSNVRGAMGVFSAVIYSIGVLFPIIVAPYVSLVQLNISCAVVACVLVFMLMAIPESPYFYMMKGKHEMAKRTLRRLRQTENVDVEVKSIAEYVEQRESQTSSAFDVFTEGRNRRPLVILAILAAMQLYSGGTAMPTYAYTIFGDSGTEISLDLLVTIMGVVALFGNIVGIFTVDCFGRRTVLLVGSSLMFLSLIVTGVFYTLKAQGFDVSSFTIVPFIALMVYAISNACGPYSLPAIILSEYFSTVVKAKVAMMYSVLLAIYTATSLKLFQLSYDGFGPGTTFFICSGLLILGEVVLFFIMPETRGQSLQNIENIHRGTIREAAATVVERVAGESIECSRISN